MKTIVKIWNVFTAALAVLILVAAVLLAGLRFAGYRPLYAMSGSMEPAVRTGSLIFVRPVDPADVAVGDVITYTINAAGDYATHRVVSIEVRETAVCIVQDEAGKAVLDDNGEPMLEEYPLEEPCICFHTKGDANEFPDAQVVYDKNVVGEPIITIPYLGYLACWLQTPRGSILGGASALALLMIVFLPDLLKRR